LIIFLEVKLYSWARSSNGDEKRKTDKQNKALQVMTKTTKTIPIGYLAQEFGGVSLPLEALPSAAGWYLGTRDSDGAPYSRESAEYWRSRDQAEAALNNPSSWTQRRHP
jgi:hypothetical protein